MSRQAKELRDALRYLFVAHGSFDEERRPCGAPLSPQHAYALLELLAKPEGLTVSELAQRLSIDRTNVSRLCARLEQMGEISRSSHPGDGRAINVKLTERGRRLAREVDERSATHFAKLTKALGPRTPSVIEHLSYLRRAIETQRNEEEERPCSDR